MAQPDDLSTKAAQKLVSKLAGNTQNIAYSDHAELRMDERGITTTHVVNALRRGAIVEGPYVSIEGDWCMNFSYVSAGMKLTVTVAIDWPSQLVIVTTF